VPQMGKCREERIGERRRGEMIRDKIKTYFDLLGSLQLAPLSERFSQPPTVCLMSSTGAIESVLSSETVPRGYDARCRVDERSEKRVIWGIISGHVLSRCNISIANLGTAPIHVKEDLRMD